MILLQAVIVRKWIILSCTQPATIMAACALPEPQHCVRRAGPVLTAHCQSVFVSFRCFKLDIENLGKYYVREHFCLKYEEKEQTLNSPKFTSWCPVPLQRPEAPPRRRLSPCSPPRWLRGALGGRGQRRLTGPGQVAVTATAYQPHGSPAETPGLRSSSQSHKRIVYVWKCVKTKPTTNNNKIKSQTNKKLGSLGAVWGCRCSGVQGHHSMPKGAQPALGDCARRVTQAWTEAMTGRAPGWAWSGPAGPEELGPAHTVTVPPPKFVQISSKCCKNNLTVLLIKIRHQTITVLGSLLNSGQYCFLNLPLLPVSVSVWFLPSLYPVGLLGEVFSVVCVQSWQITFNLKTGLSSYYHKELTCIFLSEHNFLMIFNKNWMGMFANLKAGRNVI